MIQLNGHPDTFESPPGTIAWLFEHAAFTIILIICIAGTAASSVHAASMSPAPSLEARNYYSDEVVIRSTLPAHMGLWGETDTPERGWYEAIESANSTLQTTYGAPIEDDVRLYTTDAGGRVTGVFGHSFRELAPVKSKASNASTFARGTYEALYNYLIERGLSAGGMISRSGNCIELLPELKPLAWNMMQGTHFRFPYARVMNSSTGFCVGEP